MSAATHTPGPWAFAMNSAEDYRAEVLARGGNLCVASCGTGNEASANARLISAAPDMLAALRVLVEPADLGEVDLEEEDRERLEQGRAAIAKAEGDAFSERPQAVELVDHSAELAGALSEALEQISQMYAGGKMFTDEDHTIRDAIRDGEEALRRYSEAKTARGIEATQFQPDGDGTSPRPWRVGGHPRDNSGTRWREILTDGGAFSPAYVCQAVDADAALIAQAVNLFGPLCKAVRAHFSARTGGASMADRSTGAALENELAVDAMRREGLEVRP